MITGAYLFIICAFVATKRHKRSSEFVLYFNCFFVLKKSECFIIIRENKVSPELHKFLMKFVFLNLINYATCIARPYPCD